METRNLGQVASFVRAGYENPELAYYAIVVKEDNKLKEYPFKELGNIVDVKHLSFQQDKIALICNSRSLEPDTAFYITVEDTLIEKEEIYKSALSGTMSAPRVCFVTTEAQPVAVFGEEGGEMGFGGEIQFYSERVGPR
jgi:hypothetical protein